MRGNSFFLACAVGFLGLSSRPSFCDDAAASTSAAAAETAAAAAAAAAASKGAAEPKSLGEALSSLPELEGKTDGVHETHEYQAEVSRLMDIIINSLYTQREVFLRELISNAVDALEKARFLSITDTSSNSSSSSSSSSSNDDDGVSVDELAVYIEVDKDKKVLSICDNGVGMTKQELITNLGTVAKSGTSNFLEAIASSSSSSSSSNNNNNNNNNDMSLVGQFGVGFYSAFLVADTVSVVSRSRGDKAYIWQSKADSRYYVDEVRDINIIKRGTCVYLHLKEDATEFLDIHRIVELTKRYSLYLSYPIYIKKKEIIEEEVEIDEEEDKNKNKQEEKDKKDEEDVKVEDVDEDADKTKKKKKVEREVEKYERINEQKALWLRNKDEIKPEEYEAFYRSLTNDWNSPLVYIHFSAEGEIEFKSLLFIPKRSPADIFTQYFGKQTSIKLYVRRVLVADVFDDLLPKYLHFIRGIIDSDDIPLNVSREQLQHNKVLEIINKKVVRKTLDTIRKIAVEGQKKKEELKMQLKKLEDKQQQQQQQQEGEEEEKEKEKEKETEYKKEIEKIEKELEKPTLYDEFYKEFGRNLMLGCYEDEDNRKKISKLLKFYTSTSPYEGIALETYINRMREGQPAIYYAAGDTAQQLLSQPQTQYFIKKNYEVLFLLEAMDEPCIQRLGDFEGKKFESIQKGNLSLEETEEDKKRHKQLMSYYAPLLSYMKSVLNNKISKVVVSRLLVDAPCAVVASEFGYSAQMEKVMKTQTFADPLHLKMLRGQKIFEINPNHRIIQQLLNKIKQGGKDSMTEEDRSTVNMLFDAAMLASGFDVEQPANLASLLYKGLAREVGVDPDDAINEIGDIEEDESKETDNNNNNNNNNNEGEGDSEEEINKLSTEEILKKIDLEAAGVKDEL